MRVLDSKDEREPIKGPELNVEKKRRSVKHQQKRNINPLT